MDNDEKKAGAEKLSAKAPGGTRTYRIPAPYYRDGIYAERWQVVAIPADELPGDEWKETSDPPDHVFVVTQEQKEALAKRKAKQERAQQRAAEVAARHPDVRAAAIAARELTKK